MATTSFPKSEITILLLENIHPVAKEAFATEGFQVETVSGALPEAELAALVRDAHVVGLRSKTQITAKVREKFAKPGSLTRVFGPRLPRTGAGPRGTAVA